MKRARITLFVLATVLAALAGLPAAAQAPPAAASSPGQETAAAPPAPSSDGHTQLFQVAMVVASTTTNADLDGDGKVDANPDAAFRDLPGSVRKALEDLGDFLPYKTYKLLDTALIRTSRRGQANMRGPGGREFRVQMMYRPKASEHETDLVISGFDVTDMTVVPGQTQEIVDSGTVKHTREIPPTKPKTIISTSFGMSKGETLVVGSSRLNGGNTALIMLVTAAR